MKKQQQHGGRKFIKRRPRVPAGKFSVLGPPGRVLVPPNKKGNITWRSLFTLNNAANAGANSTFALFLPHMLAPIPIGLASEWTGSTTGSGMYSQYRVLACRVKAQFTNNEAFGLRVGTYIGNSTPVNNTLITQALQQPYSSAVDGVIQSGIIGPLTGNSKATLVSTASNRRTLGVSHIRGQSDSYTTYWNSSLDTFEVATSGLSLVVLILSAVNLVSGVLVDLEADLTVEFSGLVPKLS